MTVGTLMVWGRARPLTWVLVALALAFSWTAGLRALGQAPAADEWATLIQTGDALAHGGTIPDGKSAIPSARAAYLLAFHHAQDAADVSRMLVAAARLDRLGEPALAHHARHVAAWVAASTGAGPPHGSAPDRRTGARLP